MPSGPGRSCYLLQNVVNVPEYGAGRQRRVRGKSFVLEAVRTVTAERYDLHWVGCQQAKMTETHASR